MGKANIKITNNFQTDMSFAYAQALTYIDELPKESTCVICDSEQGNVLFQYENRAVKWMDGEFAKGMIEYAKQWAVSDAISKYI